MSCLWTIPACVSGGLGPTGVSEKVLRPESKLPKARPCYPFSQFPRRWRGSGATPREPELPGADERNRTATLILTKDVLRLGATSAYNGADDRS